MDSIDSDGAQPAVISQFLFSILDRTTNPRGIFLSVVRSLLNWGAEFISFYN